MNRSDLRRLEKAAKEKDKIHLLNWATDFHNQIKKELTVEFEKEYADNLLEMIDVFCIAIAYTLHYSDSTSFNKEELPEFMEDLFFIAFDKILFKENKNFF
mgnify:CR=1 FL=1